MRTRQGTGAQNKHSEGKTPLTPLWLHASEPASFPSTIVRRKELRYELPLFADWTATPEVLRSPMQIDDVYRGPVSTDWLVVSFMPKAVPGHDMRRWIELPMAISGFPSMPIAMKAGPGTTLAAWNYEGNSAAYIAKLGVDEMHGFTGLARFGQAVARVHLLMLRKTNLAWMFCLSLHSKAGNGREWAILREDCKRAGNVFGDLRLDTSAALLASRPVKQTRR